MGLYFMKKSVRNAITHGFIMKNMIHFFVLTATNG